MLPDRFDLELDLIQTIAPMLTDGEITKIMLGPEQQIDIPGKYPTSETYPGPRDSCRRSISKPKRTGGFARRQIVRNIKFTRQMGNLAVAGKMPVDQRPKQASTPSKFKGMRL